MLRLVLVTLLLTACDASTPSDGGLPDGGALPDVPPPPACAVDVVCPDRPPEAGSYCEGALSCPYDRAGCFAPSVADCVDGQWYLTHPRPEDCSSPPIPPTGERCGTPFMGSRDGTVSVAFRGDAMIRGPQGTPMIPVEIALDGAASDLTCVGVVLALTVDGVVQAVPSALQLRLRCGATTGYLVLVGDPVTVGGAYDVDLTVTVTGVGTATIRGMLRGPPT